MGLMDVPPLSDLAKNPEKMDMVTFSGFFKTHFPVKKICEMGNVHFSIIFADLTGGVFGAGSARKCREVEMTISRQFLFRIVK